MITSKMNNVDDYDTTVFCVPPWVIFPVIVVVKTPANVGAVHVILYVDADDDAVNVIKVTDWPALSTVVAVYTISDC